MTGPGVTRDRIGATPGELSRRAVLGAVPAIMVLPLASPAMADLADESPDLLKAAQDAARAEAAFNAALQACRASVAKWSARWPLAPEPCIQADWHGSLGGNFERDLEGRALVRPGMDHPAKLRSMEELESRADHMRMAAAKDLKRRRQASQKTRAYWLTEATRCELGATLLPAYLAECARIKAASNIDALVEARQETAKAIFRAVWQVLALPHRAAAGLRIKAEAVAILGRMPNPDMQWSALIEAGPGKPSMAAVLAEAILQHEGVQA